MRFRFKCLTKGQVLYFSNYSCHSPVNPFQIFTTFFAAWTSELNMLSSNDLASVTHKGDTQVSTPFLCFLLISEDHMRQEFHTRNLLVGSHQDCLVFFKVAFFQTCPILFLDGSVWIWLYWSTSYPIILTYLSKGLVSISVSGWVCLHFLSPISRLPSLLGSEGRFDSLMSSSTPFT